VVQPLVLYVFGFLSRRILQRTFRSEMSRTRVFLGMHGL
jgi:hypothetical protein